MRGRCGAGTSCGRDAPVKVCRLRQVFGLSRTRRCPPSTSRQCPGVRRAQRSRRSTCSRTSLRQECGPATPSSNHHADGSASLRSATAAVAALHSSAYCSRSSSSLWSSAGCRPAYPSGSSTSSPGRPPEPQAFHIQGHVPDEAAWSPARTRASSDERPPAKPGTAPRRGGACRSASRGARAFSALSASTCTDAVHPMAGRAGRRSQFASTASATSEINQALRSFPWAALERLNEQHAVPA